MFGSPLGADDGMSCGQPTDTLYGTVTTTSTGELATITSQSLSTAVISGTFLSDLCASTAAGACVASTPQVLSFTYTTVATNQVVVTTRPIITTTQAVPTSTFAASCVVSETTLANGSVSNVYITVTGDTAASTSGGGGGGGSSSNGAIIGGVVGGIVVVAALIIVIWVLWRRNRQMSRQIKANEEEEKRNTIINVEELFPSPFIQTPQEHLGYSSSAIDAHRESTASPTSTGYLLSPASQTFGDQTSSQRVSPGPVAGAAASTQYTPTHSRAGSFATQIPGRPASAMASGVDQPRSVTPASVSPFQPGEASSSGVSPAASAKAREAFQSRQRSALYAQNAGEGEVDNDVVSPANAGAVRPTNLPSEPPPAYSPGDS